jgi:hypothetical protein
MNILPSLSVRKVGSPRDRGGREEVKRVISSSSRDPEDKTNMENTNHKKERKGKTNGKDKGCKEEFHRTG